MFFTMQRAAMALEAITSFIQSNKDFLCAPFFLFDPQLLLKLSGDADLALSTCIYRYTQPQHMRLPCAARCVLGIIVPHWAILFQHIYVSRRVRGKGCAVLIVDHVGILPAAVLTAMSHVQLSLIHI